MPIVLNRIVPRIQLTILVIGMASAACRADAQGAIPADTVVPLVYMDSVAARPAPGPAWSAERYATPGECASHADWTEFEFWRDHRPDTTYYPTTGHPSLRATVAAVRACMARFTLAGAPQRDLLGFGQGYLAAEQWELADQALSTLAKSVANAPVATKGWTLYQIVLAYLEAAQPQLVRAEPYVQQLDVLGAVAAPACMLAHYTMSEHARARDSVSLQMREITAALNASEEMVGDTRKVFAMASAHVYIGMANLKARQGDGAGALAILQAGGRALIALTPSVRTVFELATDRFAAIGRPAPSIRATRWFHFGPEGTVHPMPGRPSLIVFSFAGDTLARGEGWAVLRRVIGRYASRNLDVTVVTRTNGTWRGELIAPDSEMVKISDWFRTRLKLPVTVAIWQTGFGKDRDKRRTVQSAPNEMAYGGGMFIVDAHGMVRMVLQPSRDNEAALVHVLEELLDKASP